MVNSVYGISQTTAMVESSVTADGGDAILARGVCWSLTPDPATSHFATDDGTGMGPYTSLLSGMLAGSTYYVKAYPTNGAVTAYGNQLTIESIPFDLGQNYGGGIIFYIDQTGQHGLICSEEDQGEAPRGCHNTLIGGTSTSLGSGAANTFAIVTGCSTAGIGARICYDLDLNGYSDWYLPSKAELNLMYINKTLIGGFNPIYYLSSSEQSSFECHVQEFITGYDPGYFPKYNSYGIRAIRSF